MLSAIILLPFLLLLGELIPFLSRPRVPPSEVRGPPPCRQGACAGGTRGRCCPLPSLRETGQPDGVLAPQSVGVYTDPESGT